MSKLFSRVFLVVSGCFLIISTTNLNAAENNICALFKKKNGNVAYLLDKNDKISQGPIDYGTWSDDGESEDVLVPTKYKMLIYPARLSLINNNCPEYGCLKLTKGKSMCKGVATYNVEVRLVFRRKQKYYQYKDDSEFVSQMVEDPTDNVFDESLDYKFKPRFIGLVAKPAGK